MSKGLFISKQNFLHNVSMIKQRIGLQKTIFFVLKSNAYNLGNTMIAQWLASIGENNFFVNSISDLETLRKNIPQPSSIIFGHPSWNLETVKAIDHLKGEPMISDWLIADAWQRHAFSKNKILSVHLKMDTGMSRFGFSIPKNPKSWFCNFQLKHPNFHVASIFSHFSDASGLDLKSQTHTANQFKALNSVAQHMPKLFPQHRPIFHLCASSGILNYPQYCLDGARIGLLPYGISPRTDGFLPSSFKCAIALKANIVSIRNIKENQPVGYGQTYKTTKKIRMAILDLGYGDGYLNASKNDVYPLQIYVRGITCNVIGRICMDYCMLDISEIPNCSTQDNATIFHTHRDIHQLASARQCSPHEIITTINMRIPRIYN